MTKSATISGQTPLTVGDHPALDLLNTRVAADGKLVDLLRNDADVLNWLGYMGFTNHPAVKLAEGALLQVARKVREGLRTAVESKKLGGEVNWRWWNGMLTKCPSYLAVVQTEDGPAEKRRWHAETPEQVLAPVIEAAVELLVDGDFHLIRQCEDPACVLWFYDRTKSHRRRWCRMEACGNRNKVAAYRERKQEKA